MMNLIRKHLLTLIAALLMAMLAIVYILNTPKVYLISSRAAIFRMKVENPDRGWDEGRNRWIWIRDGLNVNSALLTDETLNKFIRENKNAKLFAKGFTSEYEKLKSLRDMVKVQFTGADENNYIIEVRTNQPQLGLDLNQYIFNQLKYLAVDKDQKDFNSLIVNLEKDIAKLNKKSPDYQYYQDKLMKLKFENTLAQSQKEKVFQVISKPTLNTHPVWPRPMALVLIATILGALIGLSLEYLKYLLSKKE